MDKILYLMAAEAEYGPHLRARIKPLIIGVGPVEAALATGSALALASAREQRPELVVSLGSAGSATLEQTGIFQAHSVSYRDMDASALGFERGRTPFLDLPATLPLAPILPGFRTASLSTGANVVSGQAHGRIEADMVDMETFAILRACQTFDIPLVAIRGISDGAAPLEGLASWTQYLDIIDRKLADAVGRIESFWAQRHL